MTTNRIMVGPGQWLEVEEPAAPPASTRISRLAFLNRFTDAEAIAMDLASAGATPQAAALRRAKERVLAAAFIDLAAPGTRGGIAALEKMKFLTAARAEEILAAPITEEEPPQ